MSASATAKSFAGGTKVMVKDSGTWRQIMGVKSVGGFTPTTDDADATELDPYAGLSTTPAVYNLIKKMEAGWIDLGELGVEAFFRGDEYAAALAWQLAGTDLFFRIDLRNGYSIGIYGHFKSVGMAAQQGEFVQAPVTIKLSDAIRFGTTAALSDPSTGWGA